MDGLNYCDFFWVEIRFSHSMALSHTMTDLTPKGKINIINPKTLIYLKTHFIHLITFDKLNRIFTFWGINH